MKSVVTVRFLVGLGSFVLLASLMNPESAIAQVYNLRIEPGHGTRGSSGRWFTPIYQNIQLEKGAYVVIHVFSPDVIPEVQVVDHTANKRISYATSKWTGKHYQVDVPLRDELHRYTVAVTYQAGSPRKQGRFGFTFSLTMRGETGPSSGTVVFSQAGNLQVGLGSYHKKPKHYARAYKVRLVAGTRYNIDMASTAAKGSPGWFDTYLFLLDPSGKEVSWNDDGLGNLNSRITVTPQATGYYQIIATSYSINAVGNYQLTVSVP